MPATCGGHTAREIPFMFGLAHDFATDPESVTFDNGITVVTGQTKCGLSVRSSPDDLVARTMVYRKQWCCTCYA